VFSGIASADGDKCANTTNKSVAKVAKAQAGDSSKCVKDAGNAKLDPGETVEQCIVSDPKGKVKKAVDKARDKIIADCPTPPAVPPIDTSDPDALSQIMIDKELALIHEIFGTDLDEPGLLVAKVDGKDEWKCQSAVIKAAGKCQDAKLSTYNACKKDLLKNGDPTTGELQDACMGTNGPPDHGIPDVKGKIAKKCGNGLGGTLDKKCATTDNDALFPPCAGHAVSLAQCFDEKIECEVCKALNALDGLDRGCDEFDNGVADGSCGVVCGNDVIEAGEECETDPDCPAGQFCNSLCACEAALPAAGDLVITEIMRNPSAVTDTAGEWFEVQNVSGRSLTLQGLVIQDDDFDSFTVASLVALPANGFVVFGSNADPNTNGGVNVDVVWSNFFLGNSIDEIDLFSGAVRIDRVAYDNTTFPVTAGAAMSLDPNSTNTSDNDVGSNWCDAATPLSGGDFGTPGAANPDCCGNGVLDPGEQCETAADCPAEQGCGVACTCGATVPPSEEGDLVITEIMRNPSAVSDSNGEWFEVHNPRDFNLDVNGLVVQDDGVDSFAVSASILVPPGGYLVLGSNGDPNTNGGVSVDFVWSSFILANSIDEIDLFGGAVRIDRVAYDGTTFPITAGAAMSLDPNSTNTSDNDVGSNWCEATTLLSGGDFGTPGTANPACP
jgi:hypothetical protein